MFSILSKLSIPIFNSSISDPSMLHFKKFILSILYLKIISSIVIGLISILPFNDILFLIQS